jgi:hypothetical protein
MKTAFRLAPVFASFSFCAALLAQVVPTPQPPPPSDCVMWWTFDDAPQPVARDYAEDFAADLAWDGERYHAYWPHMHQYGRVIQAAQTGDVDGDGVADFLRCAKPGWQDGISKSAFTIAFWMAPATLNPASTPAALIDARVATPDPAGGNPIVNGFAVLFDGSTIQAAASGFVVNSHTGPFDVRRFTHVAVVFPDPAKGGECAIFLDGEPAGSSTLPPWVIPTLPTLFVGKNAPQTVGRHFDGQFDDVMFYNRALLPAEIRDLATAGPGGVGPEAPAYFDTQFRRVGIDDDLAGGNSESTDPGPILSARGGCCRDMDSDGDGFVGHRFKGPFHDIAKPIIQNIRARIAGAPNGAGEPMLHIEVYPPNWKPGDPINEALVPLRLIWSPRSNRSFIGTLDLSALPDGTNLVPAIRVASAVDVSITGAIVDYIDFDELRQKAPPRDFGLVNLPLEDSVVESTPAGMSASLFDSARSKTTEAKVVLGGIKTSEESFRTIVQFPPAVPVGGTFRWLCETREQDSSFKNIIRRTIAAQKVDDTTVDYLFVAVGDLDGDGVFETLGGRTIEVFDGGALVYSGPATEATHFTAGPRQTVSMDGGFASLVVNMPPTRISLRELPPGSPVVENVVATQVRLRFRVVDITTGPLPPRAYGEVRMTASDGLPGFTVLAEAFLPDSGGDAATAVFGFEPQPIAGTGRIRGGILDSGPDVGMRTAQLPAFVRLPQGLAINTTSPRRVPALFGDGGFQLSVDVSNEPLLPRLPIGPLPTAMTVLYEVPNIHDIPFNAVAIPAFMKNARKAKTSEATINVRTMFTPTPNAGGGSYSVLLAQVDFSEIGGSGYELVGLAGDGSVKLALTSDSLPEIKFENFAAKHAINTKGTGVAGRVALTYGWGDPNQVCRVEVNGASYELSTLTILPRTQTKEVLGFVGGDDDCDGVEKLGIIEARTITSGIKKPEITRAPGNSNPPAFFIDYLRSESRLQDAAQLNGPWRDTPGAEGTDHFFYSSSERTHFFRGVDLSVPREPAP